jgi:hypothetical protein
MGKLSGGKLLGLYCQDTVILKGVDIEGINSI